MIRIPCRNGYTILSVVSFIFLSVSVVGLSMTLNTSNIPFFKQNEAILIPFLSTICSIFGIIFMFTFLDIQISNCFRCCASDYSSADDIENDRSLYDDNVGTIEITPKEDEPLLYPKIYPKLSESIKIPTNSRRTKI